MTNVAVNLCAMDEYEYLGVRGSRLWFIKFGARYKESSIDAGSLMVLYLPATD